MRIKGADGHEYNVTGQGQGNFNTVGAAGGVGWIAEKLFGGNILGGSNNCAPCSENMLVNRYEMSMQQTIAAKDARIGLLESNIYTDQKIADVYERLNTKINAVPIICARPPPSAKRILRFFNFKLPTDIQHAAPASIIPIKIRIHATNNSMNSPSCNHPCRNARPSPSVRLLYEIALVNKDAVPLIFA